MAGIPSLRTVPQMVSRPSGVSANFLCDNSKYILGIDAEEKVSIQSAGCGVKGNFGWHQISGKFV